MRQTKRGGVSVAVVGSMTNALQAERALASAAIRCEVVKQDTGGRGCGWGVTFPTTQQPSVAAVLSAAHINVRRYDPFP